MDENKINSYKGDIYQAAISKINWEKLSNKNILITGATGLIGSCIVEILMAHPQMDYHVFASGRNTLRADSLFSEYKNSPNFHFIKYDVTQPLENDIQFHYIIAAASGANPVLYSTDPVGVIKANIIGVDNLLEYGIKHGLEKFIYISSGDIYGEGDGRVFTEDYSGYVDPLQLRSCYTSSKRATETLCIAYASQFPIEVCIARPCHTYGPNFTDSDTRAYAQFIRNIINNEDIVMKSLGEQYRSWLYVVDCAKAIIYILLYGENKNAYNIADSSSNLMIRELAEVIANIGHKKLIFTNPDDVEARGFNVVNKAVFSTKKLEQLGWYIESNITEKMNHTISHILNQIRQ